MGTWEHRAILEGNKGTRTPLGDPPCWTFYTYLRNTPYLTKVHSYHTLSYKTLSFFKTNFHSLTDPNHKVRMGGGCLFLEMILANFNFNPTDLDFGLSTSPPPTPLLSAKFPLHEQLHLASCLGIGHILWPRSRRFEILSLR